MKRNGKRGPLAGLLTFFCAITLPAAAQEVKLDSDTFGGLEARHLGPGAMSGRISALAAVPGERLTIYVGSASGGLWKSSDGGIRFKPVFDKNNPSIGDIVVDRKDPRTIWVGTGETWVRNSVSVGDGVYRSTDGGDNWTKLGLEGTERIARVAIDPKDSSTVLVCATGHLFDDHPDRGVYRTKDGGKTWEKVLFVADDTGCSDLVMDPQDGRIVYAGMWQFRRKPYFFTSGGPKSGLYKSTDGGTTWRKVTKGLPEGDLGRIALAVSPARPSVVYASVESKRDEKVKGSRDTALYRSDDLGESWTGMASASAVSGRPFYFSRLVADPRNYERVYKCGFALAVSDDGGKTFGGLGGNYHGDVHDLWVNPQNTDQLVMGTDGGVYVSYDRGARWRFVGGLPVAQFYHVGYDTAYPYNVYGGLQDNLTWYGPSRAPGGIANKHWTNFLFCDGFWALPDPNDENFFYSECQGGWVYRINKTTRELKDIKPTPREGEPKYRFNWNSPIHIGPSGALYFASQFLFRSKDKGDSWERLSPDLTTNDPAKQQQQKSGGLTLDNSTAENHCTIFTIAESEKNAGVVWAGTDDGQLHVTKDGGKTWTSVVANVPGLPRNTWVSRVEASRFDEGTAYATFDGHMTGDMKTYVYKTTDHGKTWQSLASADVKGYAHVVEQDLVDKDLLFLGTELGLYVSLDGGRQWAQFTAGMPSVVAVRDLAIHPREGDLIIGTHGRGIYILDDLTPLRNLTPQVLASDVAFLPSRPSVLALPSFGEILWNGDTDFEGRSLPEVAHLVYYLKKRHIVGDLKLEVYDAQGKLVSTIQGGKRRGLNRVEWAMRQPAPTFPPGAGIIPSFGAFTGPRAPEGSYAVKLVKGKDTYTTQVQLVADPRSRANAEDKALQQETVWKLYGQVERLTILVGQITDVRDQAKARAEKLPAGDALRKPLEALDKTMEEQRQALVATQEGEGISGEEKLREELGMLYGNVNGYEGRPTASQINRMGVLGQQIDAARAKYEASAKGLATLNPQLERRKLDRVKPLTEDEWRKKLEKT